MSTTFLEGLSEEQQKQALLRISQFVLREHVGSIRDSLYQSLIEVGLFLNENECTLGEISEIIESEFYGIKISVKLLSQHIEQLERQGRLEIDEEKICLVDSRAKELSIYSERTKSLIQAIEFRFISRVETDYPYEIDISMRHKIIDVFYRFILLLVSKYVINTAKLLVKGNVTNISVKRGSVIIYDSISSIQDEELKTSIYNTLLNWMQKPEDDFIEYLYNMRQNFLSLELLNLDPECRSISDKEFSEMNIYLDTNIILGYILNMYEGHEETKNFIDNTKKLGCKLIVTKRTIIEYMEIYERGRLEYVENIGKDKKPNNIFLRNYEYMISNGHAIAFSDYLEEIKNIELYLTNNGIYLEDEILEEIINKEGYDELIYQIRRCFKILRNYEKNQAVAEHDAYHMLLIKELRETEKTTFLDQKSGF